jgi:hypothetical protein
MARYAMVDRRAVSRPQRPVRAGRRQRPRGAGSSANAGRHYASRDSTVMVSSLAAARGPLPPGVRHLRSAGSGRWAGSSDALASPPGARGPQGVESPPSASGVGAGALAHLMALLSLLGLCLGFRVVATAHPTLVAARRQERPG